MSPPFPVALSHDNAFFVTTDDRLVIADDDHDDSNWQWEGAATIIGIRITKRAVLAIDVAGQLTWLDRKQGKPLQTLDTRCQPRAFTTYGESNIWAIVDGARILVGDLKGVRLTYDLAGASCCAFDSEGACIAAGSESGLVVRINLKSNVRQEQSVPLQVDGIAWRPGPERAWLVSGGGLFQLNEDLSKPEPVLNGDLGFHGVVVSADGLAAAMRTTDNMVALIGLNYRKTIELLSYPEREPGQLAFGEGYWLAIGIGLGDANRWNFETGSIHRTDPPEGRPLNRWVVATSHAVLAEDDEPNPTKKRRRKPLSNFGASLVMLGVVMLVCCCCIGCLIYGQMN